MGKESGVGKKLWTRVHLKDEKGRLRKIYKVEWSN